MEPERGDRPQRRGGGGRQSRRRPGDRARQAEGGPRRGRAAEDGPSRGGGGNRGRSGRGGGGGHGSRRDARGREAAGPPPSACDESAATDLEFQEEEKDDQGSYSRRKIVSNWHRYEDTEKEIQNDSIESQRGTDFSVLLSSAGDSFTQFRFNEEKEWIVENLCPKQLSGLYVDCQSLVQSLEELPLHLKLNVAAELVQDAIPVTLPQTKLKSNDVGGVVQQPMGQNKLASSHYPPVGSFTPFMSPTKDGCDISSEAHQKSSSAVHQEKDNLDEDFDLLLKLDVPANPENNFASSPDTLLGNDQRMPCEEKDHLQPDGMQELCASTQQEDTSKNITEQDLEDWLDTMIS